MSQRDVIPDVVAPETSRSGARAVLGADEADPARSTADLVERAQRGDRAAFHALFRQYRADVARLVCRMLGPSSEHEDLVQEAFLQAYRSLNDFRGQSRFSTWLYRVTVNVVLMHRRAARSRPSFVHEPAGAELAAEAATPDEEVARRSRMAAFARLLERLSEKKRTAFILHELEGLSPAEIADVVGAPALTVRTRLFYARRELVELMRDEPTLAALVRELDAEASR